MQLKIFCSSVCNQSIPSIANGRIFNQNSPFFLGHTVKYECEQGFAASDSSLLVNTCIQNQLSSNGAAWRYGASSLSNVCQPGMCYLFYIFDLLVFEFAEIVRKKTKLFITLLVCMIISWRQLIVCQ